MRKKILILLLFIVGLFSFVACKNKEESSSNGTQTTETSDFTPSESSSTIIPDISTIDPSESGSNGSNTKPSESDEPLEDDLASTKSGALASLQTHVSTKKDSIYNAGAKAQIETQKNAFITRINAASDSASVETALIEGKAEIDRIVSELLETEFIVTFENSTVEVSKVKYGAKASRPNNPTQSGKTFVGWYTNETYAVEYSFDSIICDNVTVYAKWENTVIDDENGATEGSLSLGTGEIVSQGDVQLLNCSGMNESAYVEFSKAAGMDYLVYLKASTEATYRLLDSKIAYQSVVSSTIMRVDLMGLSSGSYDIRIVPNATYTNESICRVGVTAYDRSGYAHFNYTDGVGAYNDDGTLKENAIVIYVTDENKDTVMSTIPELQEFMFDIPGKYQANIPGTDWAGTKANGIGWWLNNAQYTKATKNTSGTINPTKTSNTYSPTGKSLGFYSVTEEHPIVIRFVGTVTTPEGCTGYNSYTEGGSDGDNGHMARMKDLRNVTLEGVGFNAVIDGWGFHFMNSDTTGERGKNFEVRNLTFSKYPEDALGMEGEQEDSSKTLKAPVQRCWVHHCTFLPGYAENPAESDKKEGDGSCDFKRGEYFTMSYCYYEYCHKTNLVGSSDTALQYNVSYHHNTWYNCGSRIPLLRTANIHFYNNYIYSDITDSKAELSYVTSLRANCYMYAENNYYEGCKQVFDGKTGGTAKCFGNTYLGCFSSDSVKNYTVDSRTQSVSSNCSYKDISYQNFDTNPELFYYNSETKSSDCYLTTSTVAREECLKYSGSTYRTVLNKTSLSSANVASNKHEVQGNIDLSSGSYIATIGTNATGIIYPGYKSGNKIRGQGITFSLSDYATVTIEMTHSSAGMYAGYIVSSTGEVMLKGSGTVMLKPGVYYVASTTTDKDTTVTSLTFEKYNSEEFDQKRIEEFNDLISQIPNTITFDDNCYNKIKSALEYYNTLSAELKTKVDVSKAETALQSYITLGIAKVEELISSIGTVDANSGNAISAARTMYNTLTAVAGSIVVSNYDVLLAAETAFEQYAVQSCIDKIAAIGSVSLNSEASIKAARNEYDALSEEQQALITNYSVLTSAEAEYTSLVKVKNCESAIEETDLSSMSDLEATLALYNALSATEKSAITKVSKLSQIKVAYTIGLINQIGSVTSQSGNAISLAEAYYESLTTAQKSEVTNYATLQAAREAYNEIASQAKSKDFSNGISDDFFTISGNTSTSKGSNTFNGETYTTCLKIESSTSITFTTTAPKTLTLVLGSGESGKRIKVDDTTYSADANGIVTVELGAGNHIIKKGDTANLFFIQLS